MMRAIGFLLAVLYSSPSEMAWAQNTDDSAVFDFSPPGARSRGLGGAFVAIADDATSVYGNPAGLTNLFRPEVSVEISRWRFTSLAVDTGHAFGPPTQRELDIRAGVQDRAFESSVNGLAFLSLAYPKGRWAVGLFSHQLARYHMDRQPYDAVFFACQGGSRGTGGTPPFCEESDGTSRLFPQDQSFDLNIRSTGAAFAVHATRTLSLGVAVQVFDFKLTSTGRVFAARGEAKYKAADRSPENVELSGSRIGDDRTLGVNAGGLWNVSDRWSVGATFRQGPRFHYLAVTTIGTANPDPTKDDITNNPNSAFKVPDAWAFGVAFRPSNYWRIGVEYDRILLGQLLDKVENTSTRATEPEGAVVAERLTLDDANRIRLGGEYSAAAFGGRLLSFRGGVWYDPTHLPYFRVDDPSTGYPDPGFALLFPKRDADVHVSGGLGFASKRHLQVDFAVDHSKSVSTASLSTIWRF